MKKRFTMTALVLLPAFIAAGCANQDMNNQAMGAGGGALVGALFGQAIGHNTKSTLIGAAIGAALGWGAVKLMEYNSTPVRTAEEDAKVYGIAPLPDKGLVKIRRGTSNPKEVMPGEKVSIDTDYSLQLPEGMEKTDVTESFTLKKDGEKLAELPPKNIQYGSGGYLSKAVITIPEKAEPGTYVIEHRVQAGTSYDVDESVFLVKG